MFFDPEERNLLQAALSAKQQGCPQNEEFQRILAQYGRAGSQDLKDITNDQRNDVKFVFTVPHILDPEPLTCVIEPTDELGGLYIGSVEGAQNIDLLRKHKIRAVLTASIETGVQYKQDYVHFHEIIQAHDKESYDIVQHFDKAIDFIDRNRKFTNVLVHCYLGISRSASLIIAYLIKRCNMNFEKALWKLKSKRRQINPNVGFVRQLQQYEKLQTLGKASQLSYQQPLYHPMAPQQIIPQQIIPQQAIPQQVVPPQQMVPKVPVAPTQPNNAMFYMSRKGDSENTAPIQDYIPVDYKPQYIPLHPPKDMPYHHSHQGSAFIPQLPPL